MESDQNSERDSEYEVDELIEETGFQMQKRSPKCGAEAIEHIRDTNTEEKVQTTNTKRAYTFRIRTQNPRGISKMRQQWRKESNCVSAVGIAKLSCCKRLKCFSKVDKPFLIQKIKVFLNMSNCDRRQALASMVGSSGYFYFDGNKVCSSFLNRAFRFSRDVQSSVRAVMKNSLQINSKSNSMADTTNIQRNQSSCLGPSTTSNPRSPTILFCPSKEAIQSFLLRLAEATGDRMPDCNEMHLPFHQKGEVYEQFKKDFEKINGNISAQKKVPGQSYFHRVWKAECPHIKVRKATRFSKCEICESLRDEMKRRITTFQSTTELLVRKRAHYNMILAERLEYKRKRDIAIMDPKHAWSIIVDGADQTAFGLPHFVTSTKGQKGHSLKVKLVGVLEHAVENRLRLLTMSEEHETGANHIVEAVHRFLMDRSLSSSPPHRFYVQFDNCTRENKNRFLLSYMESLVRWKLFKEVEVAFLPVGHTHEDIDQAFSTTSNRLRQNNAITLPELHHELRQVYNKFTSVTHMKYIINWRGLCQEEGVLTTLRNFSQWRYFRFRATQLSESNDHTSSGPSLVTCAVRVNVDDEWQDLPTSFLKTVPDLNSTPNTVVVDTNSTWEKEGRGDETDRIRRMSYQGH